MVYYRSPSIHHTENAPNEIVDHDAIYYILNANVSLEVTDSILNGFSGVFNLLNPSSRSLTLGSTQSLTEISTRYLPWG
jgi:hypothetical protein